MLWCVLQQERFPKSSASNVKTNILELCDPKPTSSLGIEYGEPLTILNLSSLDWTQFNYFAETGWWVFGRCDSRRRQNVISSLAHGVAEFISFTPETKEGGRKKAKDTAEWKAEKRWCSEQKLCWTMNAGTDLFHLFFAEHMGNLYRHELTHSYHCCY